MNSAEITAVNRNCQCHRAQLSTDELNLRSVLNLLGEILQTIATIRSVQDSINPGKDPATQEKAASLIREVCQFARRKANSQQNPADPEGQGVLCQRRANSQLPGFFLVSNCRISRKTATSERHHSSVERSLR